MAGLFGVATIVLGFASAQMFAMSSRVDALYTDVGSIKGLLGRVEGEVTALRRDMDAVKPDVSATRAEVGVVRRELDATRVDISAMRDAMGRIETKITASAAPTGGEHMAREPQSGGSAPAAATDSPGDRTQSGSQTGTTGAAPYSPGTTTGTNSPR